jgi:2'-5' RNA ligase
MRLFFGLSTPAELAMAVADWRDRECPAAGRPVPPANFHVTLAFIGELPEIALERLAAAVDEWTTRERPTAGALNLDHTGYWQPPGIYWLGPSTWPTGLDRMAARLRGAGQAAGGKKDRNRFQPHITLYRSCRQAPAAPATIPHFGFAYDHITLYESRQGRRGVSYHPVAEWPLDNATIAAD